MKKLKRILLWTAISAGTLLAVLLIIAASYNWIIGSQVEKRLAAIKAAGEPICLADLARKPIPPEQNATTYMRQAKTDLDDIEDVLCSVKDMDENEGYKADDLARIVAAVEAHPNLIPLLEKAAACPDFDSQDNIGNGYDLSQTKDYLDKQLKNVSIAATRSAARTLDPWCRGQLQKGQIDDAIHSMILLLKLSKLCEKEPLVVNYLVSIGVKGVALERINYILQRYPISNQSRIDLEKELALLASKEVVCHTLKTERAYSIQRFNEFPWYVFSHRWELEVLNIYDEYINNSLKFYSEWSVDDIQNKNINSDNCLAELLRPSLRSSLIATYRSQALIRSIRIINALQEKVPADSEKIPSMSELGLPDEVGIDPFNGKPMIIKKLPEGWLVYSVGQNLKDDGGDIFDPKKEGLPLDWGFGPKIPKPEK